MVRTFRLSDLDRSLIPPQSREQQLARIQQWKDAQAKLEQTCKEQGIPVPVMVC